MSYCVKIVLCVVNMKLCQAVLVRQVLKQIQDIQDIDSFKCAWKILNTNVIVILGYEHTFPIHYIFSSDI